MVAERDPRRSELIGHAIQNSSAQSRAQTAHGLAGLEDAFDHRVSIFLDDAVANAETFEIGRQHLGGKPGLFLIEVDRDQLEAHRGTPLKAHQHIEQREGILTAR